MEKYTQVSQENLHKIKKYEFTDSDINFYKKNNDDFVKTEIGDDYKDKDKTFFTESDADFAARESELHPTQKIKEPIERLGYSIVVQGIPYYVLTSDIEKLNKYIEKMEKYTQVSQDVLHKIKYEFTDSDINFYKKNKDHFVKTEIDYDYKDKLEAIPVSDDELAEFNRQRDTSSPLADLQTQGMFIRYKTIPGIPYYILSSDYDKLINYIAEKEKEKEKEKELKRQQEREENELKRQQEREERQKKIKEIKQQIIEIIEKSITDSSILQRQSKEKFINKLQEVDDNSIDPEQNFLKNFSNFFKRFDEINNKIWSTDKLKTDNYLIKTVKTDDLKIFINTSNNSLYIIKIEVPHVIFVHDYTDGSMPKLSLTKMEIGKEYYMKTSYSTINFPNGYGHFNESISNCQVKIKPQNDEELQIVGDEELQIVGDVLYKFGVYYDEIDVDKFIRIIENGRFNTKFNQQKKTDAITSLKSANKKFFYIYEIDEFEEESNLSIIDEKIAKVIKNRANLKKMKECDVKLYDNDYKLIKKSKYSDLYLRTTLLVKHEDMERLKTCLPLIPRAKVFVKDCVDGICRAFSRKVVPVTNPADENQPRGNKVAPAGGKRTRKNKKTRKHKNKKVFRKIKSFRKIRKR
jgi:hypothetical protein